MKNKDYQKDDSKVKLQFSSDDNKDVDVVRVNDIIAWLYENKQQKLAEELTERSGRAFRDIKDIDAEEKIN